ncbi:hypothetical protein [Ramlibacter aurantiacus]|uniref:hypothetical protein n=1 Tax=Ramlibacter aurantiacus TaxID=2801330 RepID=UPI001919A3D8|nr:hypothetical protein [Ramlibacter aurantiacus]
MNLSSMAWRPALQARRFPWVVAGAAAAAVALLALSWSGGSPAPTAVTPSAWVFAPFGGDLSGVSATSYETWLHGAHGQAQREGVEASLPDQF